MQNDAEFLKIAMHSYDNVQCNTLEEFNEDLKRIQIVRKMMVRYLTTGDISTRLILNHIIVLYNVFGSKSFDLIAYKIGKELHPILFAFLLFLNRLTKEQINQSGVVVDQAIMRELENI